MSFTLHHVPGAGAEDVVVAPDGSVFTGTEDGAILRLSRDGRRIDRIAWTGGRPLGSSSSTTATSSSATLTPVSGPRTGERDFLVRDLPGYPDNIARGSDGLIWVTIASPKDPLVERLQTAPVALRKLVTRIPEKLQPKPKRTIRMQAYDDAGTLVHDVDLQEPGFHMVTGVREHAGRVWMGSLHEPAVAVYDLP